MSVPAPALPLAFTGERMVPTACDLLTEAFHWQRYAFFRPWYAGARVVDAASGEGYAVTPDVTQSQPLTVGQPTEFHWTVTAQPGARGPLRADVGADDHSAAVIN